MARPNRQNIYLPDHLRDYVADAPSLSGRISTIIDRYREALRRTRIERLFTPAELAEIRKRCSGWIAEPAATIFDGIAMEVDDGGGHAALVQKLRALSPFEQVAMVEWLEEQQLSQG